MRKKLKEIENERQSFTAVYVRTGNKRLKKTCIKDATVLIKNVKNKEGKVVADHLWIDNIDDFSKLKLATGDVISFSAKARAYLKGSWESGKKFDFSLSYPRQAKLIKKKDA